MATAENITTTVTVYDREGSVLRRSAGRFEVCVFQIAAGQDFGRRSISNYRTVKAARQEAASLARSYGVPVTDFTA